MGNIETLSRDVMNIVSIDYSQSYRFMLKNNKKLINYNRNNSRLYGPIDKIYYDLKQYTDANNYLHLENKLRLNLMNIE